MVIISVDYGDVRTGVAACDKLQLLASPVTVIKQKDTELLSEEIKKICLEKKGGENRLGTS